MILPYMFKKEKEQKKKRKRNQHKPRRPPRCHNRHASSRARRPSVTVLCLSVSLQGQLANDDSNDKEEHAERQDAGA